MEDKNITYIIDNTSDLIYITDKYGFFKDINLTTERIFGLEKNQILKKNIRNFVHNENIRHFDENIDKVFKNGEFVYEIEFITKDEKIIPFEVKSKFIDYETKPMIINIARNIYERKEFEKKLMSTIVKTEDKERQRIAAELHDGLSPILSTIKLYVDLLQKPCCEKDNREDLLQTINELTNLAISTSKEISINITPSILHDFGLAVAINEFCNYINKTKSVLITLKTDKYTLDERTVIESVLYQAVKELINNTIKYSNAENITIELRNENKQIILYYRDDGDGFEIDKMLIDSGGLGLKNIINKVKSIKGTCDYYSHPKKGMVFIIVVKI